VEIQLGTNICYKKLRESKDSIKYAENIIGGQSDAETFLVYQLHPIYVKSVLENSVKA